MALRQGEKEWFTKYIAGPVNKRKLLERYLKTKGDSGLGRKHAEPNSVAVPTLGGP